MSLEKEWTPTQNKGGPMPEEKKPIPCPKCGRLNTDNWPLEINGKIEEGGCQECWEEQCDENWWRVNTILDFSHGKGPKNNG